MAGTSAFISASQSSSILRFLPRLMSSEMHVDLSDMCVTKMSGLIEV